MTKKENFKERRKHARLPIIHGVVEPVDISYEDRSGNMVSQPAILSNLSAGGMRLITFMEPPKTSSFRLCLELPGLGKLPCEARISWIRGKGGVYMTGFAFTKISKESSHKISMMAEDYEDCEMRISLKLPESCVSACKCHYLCNKPQKDETLFKTSKKKKK